MCAVNYCVQLAMFEVKYFAKEMSRPGLRWMILQIFFCMNLVCVVGCAIAAGDFTMRLRLSGEQLGLAGGAYFYAHSRSQL